MLAQLAYWMFFVLSMAFGWRLGGRDGRYFAIAFTLGSVATLLVYNFTGIENAIKLIFAIDFLLLVAICHRALTTRHYWPIWFCAFQFACVLTSFCAIIFPVYYEGIYLNLAGFWIIPGIMAMVFGILKDRKHGFIAN